MIWWIYNFLFGIVYLLLLPRFLCRMWRRGGYCKGFLQRFGIYDRKVADKLASMPEKFWIHAVSVGEIQVALRFIEELRAARPNASFVLTTTTSTAHRMAEKKLDENDILLYFPVDFPFIVRRVLRLLNPAGLILVESELWPNLVRQAAARKCKIMLLNGRISDRSYRRYKLGRFLVRRILACFDVLCAQSEEDKNRLIRLGAIPAQVKVTGSAKYDIAASPFNAGDDFFKKLAGLGFGREKLLLVGGSTWPGEEFALLEIYGRLRSRYSSLRLVLVPRHAERKKEVMAEIAKSGLSFELRSKSSVSPSAQKETEVLLVDTTGELRAFYAKAAIVFIGKSLTAKGGQNPIEAAVSSKPVIIGPHTENFAGVMADFLEAQAIIQVDDKASLEEAIEMLLKDENRCRLLGERAFQVVVNKSGALRASVGMFFDCLESRRE